MPGSGAGKGNPASKRMMNPRRKERRAASWARGERRKDARRKANEAQRAANVAWLQEHDDGASLRLARDVHRPDGSIRRTRLDSPSEARRRAERAERAARARAAMARMAEAG